MGGDWSPQPEFVTLLFAFQMVSSFQSSIVNGACLFARLAQFTVSVRGIVWVRVLEPEVNFAVTVRVVPFRRFPQRVPGR